MLRLLRSLLWLALPLAVAASPDPATRWVLAGDDGIAWTPAPGEVHADHVEMGGLRVALIVDYGLDRAGHFHASRQVIWPMLRFAPNTTRDHLALVFGEDAMPRVLIDGRPARDEVVTRVHQRGLLRVEGFFQRQRAIAFTRALFPSAERAAVFDHTVFTNRSDRAIVVGIEDNFRRVSTDPARGIDGGYAATARVLGTGMRTLQPGESTAFTVVIAAHRADEAPPEFAVAAEEAARRARLDRVLAEMQLVTPDPVLNTAFAFAKLRATESIYATRDGLMHGPGGGNYYAAIWANDQAEYANPFFAMLGDATAVESARNAFRHFARHMNPDFKPLPSSIISEGANTWHGAGDRGDMAMIAYGAARFALAHGDRPAAEELWPLIEWCLEYCRRQVTADGVVASDSDELENRFPAGRANLCTSALYYDALVSGAALARELGRPAALAEDYSGRARAVRAAVERYFGANVAGFDTYRYFDKAFPSRQLRHAHYAGEPDHLRAWICIPLTVGIHDRASGTIAALFSPRLWTEDGLATEAGKEDFWDRSTLYALRGVFAAGATGPALAHLQAYSTRRLLGDHVPYPIEAWPENNQRHLSAESALYCRIFTEGLFGLRPTGLRAATCTPRLPREWDRMALNRVHAFGTVFDLAVARRDAQLEITVTRDGAAPRVHLVPEGDAVPLDFGP